MTQVYNLMLIRHSPGTLNSPQTNQHVEIQKIILGTHNGIFLKNTPNVWAFQVAMYAQAHISQPLAALKGSPYEKVFHTRPCIPLRFDSKPNRKK